MKSVVLVFLMALSACRADANEIIDDMCCPRPSEFLHGTSRPPTPTIEWSSDLVIGGGSKRSDCAPGSVKFEDNKLWVCKLFPRYVEVETKDPKK